MWSPRDLHNLCGAQYLMGLINNINRSICDAQFYIGMESSSREVSSKSCFKLVLILFCERRNLQRLNECSTISHNLEKEGTMKVEDLESWEVFLICYVVS